MVSPALAYVKFIDLTAADGANTYLREAADTDSRHFLELGQSNILLCLSTVSFRHKPSAPQRRVVTDFLITFFWLKDKQDRLVHNRMLKKCFFIERCLRQLTTTPLYKQCVRGSTSVKLKCPPAKLKSSDSKLPLVIRRT